jgi:hypothetical protein
MKKEYKKPEIMFESFALSTNIAACGFPATFAPNLGNACEAYQLRNGDIVFVTEFSGCVSVQAQNGDYNGVCYHVPTISLNLLNS